MNPHPSLIRMRKNSKELDLIMEDIVKNVDENLESRIQPHKTRVDVVGKVVRELNNMSIAFGTAFLAFGLVFGSLGYLLSDISRSRD